LIGAFTALPQLFSAPDLLAGLRERRKGGREGRREGKGGRGRRKVKG